MPTGPSFLGGHHETFAGLVHIAHVFSLSLVEHRYSTAAHRQGETTTVVKLTGKICVIDSFVC